MTFENLMNAVSIQIERMISLSTELFYVEVDRDELFDLYLASFPKGTNPIFRERTVHDCSCCKRFIRDFGHVVTVINGRIETIWDVRMVGFYDKVARTLSEDVKFRRIAGIYRHNIKILGGKQNRETLESGIINIYDHFYYTLPSRFVITLNIDTFRGNARTNKEVLERSLTEISLEASELVIELIEQNSLYRGEEFLHVVQKFQTIKKEFDSLSKNDKDIFLWQTSANIKEAGRFKNTVYGTLLYDISIGTELEEAVRKFETKVAPTNYKRPTALITQGMIDKAEENIVELGIEKSLARRFATAKDLTVNNVIFAGKSTKKKMKRGKKKKSILANLEPTKNIVDPDKIQKVNIDEFVATILPHVTDVEIMVVNSQINNLMSVIAPKNGKSPNVMKWDNPFSWSYNGEVTDSIKERVKRAGGDVEGFMRCSLSWYNHDDLDIHAIEPDGSHIFYGDKRSHNGTLDVDMNVSPTTREPVENITWKTERNLQEGRYKFYVNQYTKRETKDVGFQVEMELDGQTYLFTYDNPLKQQENVHVIEFTYSKSGIIIVGSLPSTQTSKEIWGIETHKWTRVRTIMNSPNHWNGERIGNRHFFFILEDCLNPDKARGFYNEFLKNELTEHRKVFEVLSSKMKADHTDKQLSGVGFSSTQENSLLCRVSGQFDRTMMITFANITGRFGKEPILIEETLGLCEVCKRDVTSIQSRLPCPNECHSIFHTSHFIEWQRVTGKCPVCREPVTQLQVNEIVQLATV